MWIALLMEKSEALKKFKRFKSLAEQETKAVVKVFRTDRGGEFMSDYFIVYCDKNGINRHLTAPYSPQHNGVIERHNRILFEMTRSILKDMSVQNFLWRGGGESSEACHLLNK